MTFASSEMVRPLGLLGTTRGRPESPEKERVAMWHMLEFTAPCTVDLHRPDSPRLEQLLIEAGQKIEAQVRPYVHDVDGLLIECADLFLAHGEALYAVPMEYFTFL
jgi:hypothetical protein